MDCLAKYIADHGDEYKDIWMTADWHPITHISFKENGGIWPIHCLQYSKGAAIYAPILKAICDKGFGINVLAKGNDEDKEDYSVFHDTFGGMTMSKILGSSSDSKIIDVCGLALDFCVKETVMDGFKYHGRHKWRLLTDYTQAIEDRGKTINELNDYGIEIA